MLFPDYSNPITTVNLYARPGYEKYTITEDCFAMGLGSASWSTTSSSDSGDSIKYYSTSMTVNGQQTYGNGVYLYLKAGDVLGIKGDSNDRYHSLNVTLYPLR